jgi:hypothetical protein
MNQDYRAGRRRLPGDEERGNGGPGPTASARFNRDEGVRRVRRMSNWTAAALVAGVAVTTGYFAHAATGASQQATTPGTVSTGPPGTTGQPGTTAPGHKASVTHPVATSGGSGVTGGGGGGGGDRGGDN